MPSIEDIRALAAQDKITYANHAQTRMEECSIDYTRLKLAMMRGELIENYPCDPRGDSCLIADVNQQPLHLVCSITKGQVNVITTYEPNSDKWLDDLKTRRTKQ